MKYRFDDDSIVIGFIKELLHNFNLPTIDVYKDKAYKNKLYIKDNKIVRFNGDKFITLDDYSYDMPIINFTSTLDINSSTYDKYTHEYLGNYLRFIRDYKKVDLMCLYNCFDYREPSKLVHTTKTDDKIIEINTYDTRFNYYIVPVKFNQQYTVAIDAHVPYEMFCIINSNNFLSENGVDDLITETYVKKAGSVYTQPFIFDLNKIKDTTVSKLSSKEKELMLLLKLPKRIESTITILEGNYTMCKEFDGLLVENILTELEPSRNIDDKLKYTKLSLLRLNNRKSYPFADRLVEYLVGNVISPLDNIPMNIERIQDVLYKGQVIEGYYGIWSDSLRNKLFEIAKKIDKTKGDVPKMSNKIKLNDNEGKSIPRKFNDTYDDVLYYVDKDVETLVRLEDQTDA